MGASEDMEGGGGLQRMAGEEEDECASIQEKWREKKGTSRRGGERSRGGERTAGLCW